MDKWSLNEKQIIQISETDPVEVEESKVSYDIRLPKQERVYKAKEILNQMKCKEMERFFKLGCIDLAIEVIKDEILFLTTELKYAHSLSEQEQEIIGKIKKLNQAVEEIEELLK